MILVLADDFSGAAECAVAARRFGLTAEVQTHPEPNTRADVVAVDTETRSLAPGAAAERVERIARVMLARCPSVVFKKVDSVLRGRVAVEIAAVRLATGRRRGILIPANPGRGRVIRGGSYFINDTSLHQTPFAADPEYPATSSDIRVILAERSGTTVGLPDIPDCENTADLFAVANIIEPDTLPAGGSEFFEALLSRRYSTCAATTDLVGLPVSSGPILGVRGSAYPGSSPNIPVATTPEAAYDLLATQGIALLTLAANDPSTDPSDRLKRLGVAAETVLRAMRVNRLLLDGGATAAAVLNQLGWVRFQVANSNAMGLSVLREIDGRSPEIVVKPGSYPWAPTAWSVTAP